MLYLLRWISSDKIATSAGGVFDNRYAFLQSVTGGESSSLKYEINNWILMCKYQKYYHNAKLLKYSKTEETLKNTKHIKHMKQNLKHQKHEKA